MYSMNSIVVAPAAKANCPGLIRLMLDSRPPRIVADESKMMMDIMLVRLKY
jgi:hypothetical protein